MVAKFHEGDVKGAAEIQLKAIPLVNALFSEVNPIPVKAALNLMGMNAGPLRMPLYRNGRGKQREAEKSNAGFWH